VVKDSSPQQQKVTYLRKLLPISDRGVHPCGEDEVAGDRLSRRRGGCQSALKKRGGGGLCSEKEKWIFACLRMWKREERSYFDYEKEKADLFSSKGKASSFLHRKEGKERRSFVREFRPGQKGKRVSLTFKGLKGRRQDLLADGGDNSITGKRKALAAGGSYRGGGEGGSGSS